MPTAKALEALKGKWAEVHTGEDPFTAGIMQWVGPETYCVRFVSAGGHWSGFEVGRIEDVRAFETDSTYLKLLQGRTQPLEPLDFNMSPCTSLQECLLQCIAARELISVFLHDSFSYKGLPNGVDDGWLQISSFDDAMQPNGTAYLPLLHIIAIQTGTSLLTQLKAQQDWGAP